jgi:hypothetical protein
MYKSAKDSGYDFDDERRFDVLRTLKFSSLLDVGSGPCLLKSWLQKQGKDCSYEAVDIREDTLELCDCPKYNRIPNKKYDVVCLFGTCGYKTEQNDKELLFGLLEQSKSQCNKYLIFSVIINRQYKEIVSYSTEELIELLENLKVNNYRTLVDTINSECIVFCEI